MVTLFQMVIFSLFVLFYAASSAKTKDLSIKLKCYTKHYGCYYVRSHNRCVCTIKRGCENNFKYKTRQECNTDNLYKKKIEPCAKNPCNQGTCSPNKNGWRKYTCNCLETGFYGKRCHKKCPQMTLYYAMENHSHFFEQKDWKRTLLACIVPRPPRTIL